MDQNALVGAVPSILSSNVRDASSSMASLVVIFLVRAKRSTTALDAPDRTAVIEAPFRGSVQPTTKGASAASVSLASQGKKGALHVQMGVLRMLVCELRDGAERGEGVGADGGGGDGGGGIGLLPGGCGGVEGCTGSGGGWGWCGGEGGDGNGGNGGGSGASPIGYGGGEGGCREDDGDEASGNIGGGGTGKGMAEARSAGASEQLAWTPQVSSAQCMVAPSELVTSFARTEGLSSQPGSARTRRSRTARRA